MMTDNDATPTRILPDPQTVCHMLVAELRSRMMTVQELATARPAHDKDMGPEVTLPMMHMHLLLIDRDGLQARIDTLEMQMEEARLTSLGFPPERHTEYASPPELRLSPLFDAGWSDDNRGDYAGKIAETVLRGQNPHDAACVLFQACAAILTVTYPSALAVRLIRAMGDGSIFDLGGQLGLGETLQ